MVAHVFGRLGLARIVEAHLPGHSRSMLSPAEVVAFGVRTTNLAERSFEEERRRTTVIPRLKRRTGCYEAGFRHHDAIRRALDAGIDQ